MFVGALLIIDQLLKQPRYPSVGKCINKLWYTQAMEHYSALKRLELSSPEKMWKNLKCMSLSHVQLFETLCILLHKRGKSEKATYCMIQSI